MKTKKPQPPDQVRPAVFTTVWRNWKEAFKKNALMLTLTLVFYNLSAYFDQMLKPMFWKQVFDQINQGLDPMKSFYYIIGCFALSWILSRLGDLNIIISESNIIKNLRDTALHGLMMKDSKFFANHFIGSLVSKSGRFANESEKVIDHGVFTLSRTAILVIYILIYTFVIMPDVGLIFLIWVTVFVLVTIILLKFSLRADVESSEKDSKTNGVFSDILTSLLYLRSFSREHAEFENFKKVSGEERAYKRRAWFLVNFQWAVQGILVAVLEIVVMYTLMHKVMDKVETIGTLAMMQVYIISLANNMYQLGQSLKHVRTGFTDAYEMAVILDDKTDCGEEVLKPSLNDSLKFIPNHVISFEKVSFSYDSGARKVLENFCFDFQAGRHYGVVGQSGAGKSTLFKILLRQSQHESGNILIGGANINGMPKADLRSLISYVPQSPTFPSRKIIDILKLGKNNATDAEVRLACEKAGCHFIWDKFPNGFDTYVGERGVKLSGGEAQRVAIAVAILKDAPIIIMDEPTSSLDAETESLIQKSITKHFVGKTMLVIAHRLATVAVLDEVLLIENGQVVHNAPHAELLGKSESYAKMWQLQTSPVILQN
ncbi:hypothetical protein A3J61_00195 [Candidatus Nomurabacteria bacterium RIFCSPHIGHO2_02_FULL_38_15]|uniref:ABC transporter ATP-binding protein n=1 Tax=Candidatus Nomurabacteria bacterium RIFCSPHIGHO2_02_FULL_38_15 TaxID=1801752 RepID=A0A1F6VSS6_9BACT|nr:MAG: hypothetical protein A3J61_00195 [Candidatus Nomurabacteria bacterium RIFCSPHIGHO2_02_FULL_38_15]